MASNKKTALMKQQMREISKLLAENKEEKARIRAEALIRDDGTIEAYEILQLTCELLVERLKLITTSKTVQEDLRRSISTLIWASNRVDIKELVEIRKQIKAKFGKQFDMDAFENKNNICNERVIAKLSVQPPTALLVQTYLEKIADQFSVQWKPTNRLKADQLGEPMAAPVGYSVNVAPGSRLVPMNAYAAEEHTATDAVSEMGGSVGGSAPPPAAAASVASVASANSRHSHFSNDDEKKYGDDIPVAQVIAQHPDEEPDIYIPPAPGMDKKPPADDFDELQARFNNLKRF
jgi:vacuolar protein sorting-associated protein IST1